jgi:hypothetical protein
MTIRDYLGKFADYFSRKFLLACASLVSGAYITLKGMDVLGFSALVGVVLTAYNGANVAETYAAVKHAIADRKIDNGDTGNNGAKVKVDVDTGT